MSNNSFPTSEIEHIKDSPVLLAIFVTINTASILLAITSNSVVLWVIYRTHRLHNPPNFFISSLASLDLISGILSIPLYLFSVSKIHVWETDKFLIRMDEAFSAFMIFGTATNISMISLDRLIAIKWSLRYHTIMTHSTASKVIKTIWIASALLSIPMLFLKDPNHEYYWLVISAIMLLGPFLVTLCCYSYIIKKTNEQQRKLFPKQDGTSLRFKIRNVPQLRKNRKAAKTFLIVIVIFILLFLPNFLSSFHFLTCSQKDEVCIMENGLLRYMDWYMFIFYSSCYINPIIYAFSNGQFRSAMRTCIHRSTARFSNNKTSHVKQK